MTALEALGWGLVAGAALVVGASIGFFTDIPTRLIAAVMAFGGGVLISALSFGLMDEAYQRGNFVSVGVGFLLGGAAFSAGNWFLARHGAKHRKRSGTQQAQSGGAGLSIALGSLMDGIPEAVVIGVSLINGGAVYVAVTAIALSNIPEGLSSSAGMRKAGRSARYVMLLWIGIALVCGVSALAGYGIFAHLGNHVVAATTAVAAGAVLAMLADTMLPEAFAEAHDWTGIVAVVGFFLAFLIGKA